MAGSGIWKVQIKSDEAIKKGPQSAEGTSELGFKLRFKTGEYAKDADTESTASASSVNDWT